MVLVCTLDRMARGNGAARRWTLVFVVVAVLVALPAVVAAWPAADDDRSAAELRAAALASAELPYSGFAESTGRLALPTTDQLGSLADLLSDRTEMRVWWRGATDNRVDVVTAVGETDVYQDPAGTWTWEYEANRVTRTENAALALPAPPDLLPPTLARRLLSEADPAELSRIGVDRIAGRDAVGVRLTPAASAASVGRVEVFVDAGTGLPLRVAVYAKASDSPALDTRFVDLELATPDPGVTSFTPPARTRVRTGGTQGVLQDAGRQLSPIPLPDTLAGLPRRTIDGAPPAVGLYGRGVTLLTVVPLPSGVAADLRRAATQDPTAVSDGTAVRFVVGPVGIQLVGGAGTPMVLAGTVTPEALQQAAAELAALAGRS